MERVGMTTDQIVAPYGRLMRAPSLRRSFASSLVLTRRHFPVGSYGIAANPLLKLLVFRYQR
jgi:hypothetical protein